MNLGPYNGIYAVNAILMGSFDWDYVAGIPLIISWTLKLVESC